MRSGRQCLLYVSVKTTHQCLAQNVHNVKRDKECEGHEVAHEEGREPDQQATEPICCGARRRLTAATHSSKMQYSAGQGFYQYRYLGDIYKYVALNQGGYIPALHMGGWVF